MAKDKTEIRAELEETAAEYGLPLSDAALLTVLFDRVDGELAAAARERGAADLVPLAVAEARLLAVRALADARGIRRAMAAMAAVLAAVAAVAACAL